MGEYFTLVWDWLGDEDHRARLLAILAVLTFIGGLLGWFFGLFKRKLDPQPLTTLPTDQPVMMMKRSVFEAELEKRAAEVEAALATASEDERTRLEGQRAEIARRLADVEGALKERAAKVRDLEALLTREGNEIGGDRLAEARAALEQGDFSKADALFAEIEARAQMAVQSTARAAYGRGEIAEEQVRWADAAEHYGRAARLELNYNHLRKAVEFTWRSGAYTTSVNLANDLVSAASSEFGPSSQEMSLALDRHATTLQYSGHYERAEPLFRQVLEIDEKTIGTEHRDYAVHLNNLALLLWEMKRYDEAEPLYREVLAIAEKTIGTEHQHYATHLSNLANLLRDMGRHDEAEPLYRQATEIGAKTIGTAHPDYAVNLSNLAGLLRDMGRHDEAEPLYRQALEIAEKTIGTAHPHYAIQLNNLAGLLRAMGRTDEAGPLYVEALEILRAKLGPDHPNTKAGEANYAAFLAERDAAAPD